MYIFKFAKIDFLKSKSMAILLLFPAMALILCLRSANDNALFALSYCVFGEIVMASIPFQLQQEHEVGFVQMLPAKPGDSVRGHFLYGVGCLAYGFLAGLAAMGLTCLFRSGAAVPSAEDFRKAVMVMFSFALILMAFQGILLSVHPFDNARAMQLLRLVPGFLFFFGINYASEQREIFLPMARLMAGNGIWVLPAVGMALYLAASEIAVRLWDRQT